MAVAFGSRVSPLTIDNFSHFKLVAVYQPKSQTLPGSHNTTEYTIVTFRGDRSEIKSGSGFAKLSTLSGIRVPMHFPNADKIPRRDQPNGTFERRVKVTDDLFFDVLRFMFTDNNCAYEKIELNGSMDVTKFEKCVTVNCQQGATHEYLLKGIEIRSLLPFAPESMVLPSRSSSRARDSRLGSVSEDGGEVESPPRTPTSPFSLPSSFEHRPGRTTPVDFVSSFGGGNQGSTTFV